MVMQDITSWMYGDLVKRVPLFRECEEAFISHLVMRLRLGVYLQVGLGAGMGVSLLVCRLGPVASLQASAAQPH
jgi:hypothetical protein